MNKYTAKNRITYDLQPGFLTGEVAILSEGKSAWRIDKAVLAEASSVFRDMFANSTPGVHEFAFPNTTPTDLDIFLRAITRNPHITQPSFNDARRALDLLLQYSCIEIAKSTLYNCCREVEMRDQIDAFAVASQLNDIMSGTRILLQGYRWYTCVTNDHNTIPSLSPQSTAMPWAPPEPSRLGPAWSWALTMASAGLTGELSRAKPEANFPPKSDPKFWSMMVGEFMRYLTL